MQQITKHKPTTETISHHTMGAPEQQAKTD
jgi:hypothetical protein